MTTTAFGRRVSPTAQALAAIHAKHPAVQVLTRDHMKCERCGGRLNFTVYPGGRVIGTCASFNCLAFDAG